MINLDDFKKTIDNKFWKHITKDTLIYSEETRDKDQIITDLVSKVNSGVYVSSGVKNFIIYSKTRENSNRIARLVPSFYVSDYIFSFYLIKKIEKELSKAIHPNAFGSFRNFKYFRDKEKNNHELLGYEFLPSIASTSSYYKYYWMFEWKEFMGKSRRLFQNTKYKYFIMFDIADFYSSINLSLLERKIRAAVEKDKQIFIDLLFYFLQHCNNKFKKYMPETKGIPQDEVGDVSRVLANYFLQSFDHEINNFAKKLDAEVLRFADDHIIYAKNEKIASQILFYASIQLQRLGLAVNGSKIKDYSRTEFKEYWAFDIHELLDKNRWQQAAELYKKRNNKQFRSWTVLARFLRAKPSKLKPRNYLSLCDELIDKNLVSSLSYPHMIKLFYFLPLSEQKKFLKQLESLVKINNFNSYHYNLLKAINNNEDFKKYFNDKKVKKINDRIKELTEYYF